MLHVTEARVIVAGEETNRRDIARILHNAGHHVREVALASEVLRVVSAEAPDLAVLQSGSANQENLDFCRRVHERPRAAGTAVVLVSRAFADSAQRVAGLEAGAGACLAEPIEPAELLAQANCLLSLRQVETKLRESEERFRLATEAMDGMVYDWRVTAGISKRSVGIADFLGWRPEEVPEDSDWWPSQIHPDDALAVQRRFEQAVARRAPDCRHEYRIRHKNGHYLWIWDTNRIVYDSDGKLVRVIGCAVSIDERKRVNEALREAKEQLARVNEDLEHKVAERTTKLVETVTELESWSYSIAHDMRAPLRTMHSFSRMLADDYGSRLDAEACSYLKRIDAAAKRMDQYIRDLLDYGKLVRGDLPMTRVDVATLIDDILATYPDLQPDKCRIHVQRPLPPVQGNSAALTQVISNLLGNAVKFVDPGTFPAVEIRAETRPGWVRLWFEDNGTGIDDRSLERIFGIFQRIHPPGAREGTGIGLAIVRRAVERMGGSVGVESTPGQGSRFWVNLKECS
jgi:PAS domain S-box-containing protein